MLVELTGSPCKTPRSPRYTQIILSILQLHPTLLTTQTATTRRRSSSRTRLLLNPHDFGPIDSRRLCTKDTAVQVFVRSSGNLHGRGHHGDRRIDRKRNYGVCEGGTTELKQGAEWSTCSPNHNIVNVTGQTKKGWKAELEDRHRLVSFTRLYIGTSMA